VLRKPLAAVSSVLDCGVVWESHALVLFACLGWVGDVLLWTAICECLSVLVRSSFTVRWRWCPHQRGVAITLRAGVDASNLASTVSAPRLLCLLRAG
jgi:hypothetical protein